MAGLIWVSVRDTPMLPLFGNGREGIADDKKIRKQTIGKEFHLFIVPKAKTTIQLYKSS